MGKSEIRILIADGHALFRDDLKQLLDAEDNITCVATAADRETAVRLVAELRPDIALVDLSLPGGDGFETAQYIRAHHPATAVVLISSYQYEYFVTACREADISGYLPKDTPRQTLVRAIRRVYAGQRVFSRNANSDILYYTRGNEAKEDN